MNPLTGDWLDLSAGVLRAVSPIHIQYLQNMGATASMSIALSVGGRLWGLISAPPLQRPAARPARGARDVRADRDRVPRCSSQALEQLEAARRATALGAAPARTVLDRVAASSSILEGLASRRGAAGGVRRATARRSASTASCGRDDAGRRRRAARRARRRRCSPPTDARRGRVPGVLAAPARPSRAATTSPGSGPSTCARSSGRTRPSRLAINERDRLNPDGSFRTWAESVRGESPPWAAVEVESVTELRTALGTFLITRAEQLAALNAELARSNEELDAFAYVAAHDLKEPLRGIANYTTFLVEDYEDALDADAPRTAGDDPAALAADGFAAGLAARLLADRPCRPRPDRLHGRRGARGRAGAAGRRKPALTVEGSEMALRGDRIRVRQLLVNLIGNASSTTPDAPEISVVARDGVVLRDRQRASASRPEHHDAIFHVFRACTRATRTAAAPAPGSTIARRIAERHGGRLWLEQSDARAGLDASALPSGVTGSPRPASPSPSSRTTTKTSRRSRACCARPPRASASGATRAARRRSPACSSSDTRPALDDPGPQPAGHPRHGGARRASSGDPRVRMVPVIVAVRLARARRTSTPPTRRAPTRTWPSRWTSRSCAAALSMHEFWQIASLPGTSPNDRRTGDGARGGRQPREPLRDPAATSRAASSTSGRPRPARQGWRMAARDPDLIVLDVHLPDINGFEVCRRLKEDERTRHIPVLQRSQSHVDDAARVHGLESGADAYLTRARRPVRAGRDRPRAAARPPRREPAAAAEPGRRPARDRAHPRRRRCSPSPPPCSAEIGRDPTFFLYDESRRWLRETPGEDVAAELTFDADDPVAEVARTAEPRSTSAGHRAARRLRAPAGRADRPGDAVGARTRAPAGALRPVRQALERAGLYEYQHHIATTLQEGLLPESLPEIAGAEVAARYNAGARAMEVGGDFYDVFPRGEDWVMVIGDVCGRGAEAAALTGLARHTIRAQAQHLEHPSEILRALHDAIVAEVGRDSARFVTAGCVLLGRRRCRARLVRRPSAGPDRARRRRDRSAPAHRPAARTAPARCGSPTWRPSSSPATRSCSTPTA